MRKRKKICLLHTGGTIGMMPSENGYSPKAGYLRGALSAIEDLKSPMLPEYELYELSPLLDSSE